MKRRDFIAGLAGAVAACARSADNGGAEVVRKFNGR